MIIFMYLLNFQKKVFVFLFICFFKTFLTNIFNTDLQQLQSSVVLQSAKSEAATLKRKFDSISRM